MTFGPTPVTAQMADGMWLASTPKDCPMSVGSFGTTEEEARLNFELAVERRQEAYAGLDT